MKPLFALFAVTAALLTACPAPTPPAGTAVPTTGGISSSSDTQAVFNAPSAGMGTFVNVSPSSDEGQIPAGLTFVRAYDFQVTAGSVPNASISIIATTTVSSVAPTLTKAAKIVDRLYRRDGNFWRFVAGQTNANGQVSVTVQTYGIYGVLRGIATIKDIAMTPNPVSLTVGQTQQMAALVRDSLNQPMPSIDSPISWMLESATLASVQASQNTISDTGLFTANSAGQDKIIATTNQNIEVRVPVTVTGLMK